MLIIFSSVGLSAKSDRIDLNVFAACTPVQAALLVEKVFFGKQGDFWKGDEMACSLPRSCTKVLREGKNATNAH